MGTALLLATVVGSGIMAERLTAGNIALALLCNTVATGAGLVALILTFGPTSGAHFNPAVTLADASQGGLRWPEVGPYLAAQIVGAFAGVALAHAMFGEPIFAVSTHIRAGRAQLLSEAVATFGLLCVIWGVSRARAAVVPRFRAVGALHHGRVLVHRLHLLRQSGCDAGTGAVQHLRWHTPDRCTRLYRGAAAWRRRRFHLPLFRWLVPALPLAASERCRPAPQKSAPMSQARILFLCTGNSCRSQMAEGWARFLGKGRVEAFSAGTHPKPIHPLAIQVMAEVGVDIADQQSKSVDQFIDQRFDFVITVCDRAKEACPVWPGARSQAHWSFDDPAEGTGSHAQQLVIFRRVRDEIRQRLRLFLIANSLEG